MSDAMPTGPASSPSRRERRAAASERSAARRRARRSRYEALFPPAPLAAAGAAVSAAFLFHPSLAARAAMLVLFMAAASASGKRIPVLGTLLVSAGIVAANLLAPVGRVLARLGPLVVTEVALLDGLRKAVTFEGLIYLSKATILPSLRIPGRLGSIVAAAFVYYDRIVEYKGRVRPASLIEDADALMLKVWEEGPAELEPEARSGGRGGAAILAAAVLAAYAALALALVTP